MKQNYDFKIDKINNLSPEEISLRKKNLEAWKVSIRVSCHIIEKGLTMPERRLGFGLPRLAKIANEILS